MPPNDDARTDHQRTDDPPTNCPGCGRGIYAVVTFAPGDHRALPCGCPVHSDFARDCAE